MKQSQCPVCGRDVLADFPGLQSVCPQCEKKLALKEELVDLRMKLAEAENQALRINQFKVNTHWWKLIRSVNIDIEKADDKLCELAGLLGLDKIGLVEPRRVN